MLDHLQLLPIEGALRGVRLLDFYLWMRTLLFQLLWLHCAHCVLIISLLFTIHLMERLLLVLVILWNNRW